MKTCKDCKKIFTAHCPIRIWGRNEANAGKSLDVNPKKDYCSRLEDHPKEQYPTGGVNPSLARMP